MLRDENSVPVWFGVSCVDGVTLVPIAVSSVNGGMQIDLTTAISFVPDPRQATLRDENGEPVKTGISTASGSVILPLYVNPANGKVLADA